MQGDQNDYFKVQIKHLLDMDYLDYTMCANIY